MKIHIFLICFVISLTSWSQVSFTSPITQHFPTGELELIDRTITFDGKEFVIESKTSAGNWHVQKWIVKEYSEMEFPIHGLSHFYVCEAVGGLYTTYILIPSKDPIEYLEIVQPQQYHFEPQHLRFLVD